MHVPDSGPVRKLNRFDTFSFGTFRYGIVCCRQAFVKKFLDRFSRIRYRRESGTVRTLRYNAIKVELLHIRRGRYVVRRICAGDGPLTCVKRYLEYNRKIFQLILH